MQHIKSIEHPITLLVTTNVLHLQLNNYFLGGRVENILTINR